MPKVVWPIVNQIGLYETLQAVIVLMMVGVALVAAARPIAALDRLETFIGRVARRPMSRSDSLLPSRSAARLRSAR